MRRFVRSTRQTRVGLGKVSCGQLRADALGLLVECALAGGLDRGTAGDRHQVVLHVEAAALQSDRTAIGTDAGQTLVKLPERGLACFRGNVTTDRV